MQRDSRPEELDLPSPHVRQVQHRSSDRTPSFSTSSLVSPPSVTPDPAYIAPSAASHMVNSEYVNRGNLFHDQVSDADVLQVSPASITLINAFLDQLLFSFLASSRSTSIVSLRPAVSEVLKPRLAKEAIQGADEELKGYLAGGDDEELGDFHNGQELKGERNLHRIFRRTRLRCMVYTRLGDMEEEDEEAYLESDQAKATIEGQRRLSMDLGSVSPAAAIFLTSIVEFVGEHAFIVAGEAAWNRLATRKSTSEDQSASVEEADVEKLAFNTTLGRLWRSWKNRVRTSTLISPRSLSHHGFRTSSISTSGKESRTASISEGNESGYFDAAGQRANTISALRGDRETDSIRSQTIREPPEEVRISTNLFTRKTSSRRPHSMVEYSIAIQQSRAQAPSELIFQESSDTTERPTQWRKRSSSVPAKQTPYVSPINETFTTPSEGPDPFRHDHRDREKAEAEVPMLTDDSKVVAGLTNNSTAVSTMYDGVLKQGTDTPEIASRAVSSMSAYTDKEADGNNQPTPQAFGSKNPPIQADFEAPADTDEPASSLEQVSPLSSNYSFHRGDIEPSSEHKTLGKNSNYSEVSDGGCFPNRGDSLDQLPVGSDSRPAGYGDAFTNLVTVQGDRLRTYDNDGRAVKRDIPVLYEAPSNQDVIYKPKASEKHLQDDRTHSSPVKAQYSAPEADSRVPTLTPLRDLSDTAQDTSDETSSIAPSYETSRSDGITKTYRSSGPDVQASGLLLSSNTTHVQPSAPTGKSADVRSQPLSLNTGTERAAVQLVSPSSAGARNSVSPFGRTSTSSNRDTRPATPGSTTSQMSTKIKGMMGRESGDISGQPAPERSSSANSEGLPGGPKKISRSGGIAQDFEQLIKSDETIQYTLTPQNMREMEASDSPRWSAKQPSNPNELTTFQRSTASSDADRPSTSRSVISPLKGLNGLRSNPTNGSKTTEIVSRPAVSGDTNKPQTKVIPKSPGGKSGSTSRSLSAQDNSLRDFADFIRSTGPDAAPNPMPKSLTSNPTRASRPGSSSGLSTATLGRLPSKKITKQNPISTPEKSERNLPARTSSKLKARDPIASSNNTTADLADFLRSGPADGQIAGARQAQRGQTAMQPTTFANDLTNGRVREAVGSGTSVASTQDSFTPSKRTQSSTNSRTGLLGRNNSQRPTQNNEPPPGPARKQKRVRDPYAIDSDSEGDHYENPPGPEREEESLNDFLRDYNPPPPATTRTTPARNPANNPGPKQRKPSGPTLRERIARNIAVVPDYRPLPPQAPKKNPSKSPPVSNGSRRQEQRQPSDTSNPAPPNSQRGRPTNTTAPQLPPLSPRATSPHLVTQNGTKMDTYRPTQPTYAKHVDRRPKQLQAREEHGVMSGAGGGSGSGMADLADFLRETEPPAPSGPISRGGAPSSMSPTKEKKESTFGGMFSRRKKGSVF